MKKLIIVLFAVSFTAIGFSQTNTSTEKAPQEKVVVQKEAVKTTQVTVNSKLERKVPSKVITTKEQMMVKDPSSQSISIKNETNKTENKQVVLQEKKPVITEIKQ